MRTGVLSLCLVAIASVGSVRAQNILFDFDDLGRFDGSRNISTYMTEQFGSTVTVEGARARPDADDAADLLIATSLQLLDRGDFEILFEETPIIGLQFEGYVIDATPDDDFTLTLFNDDLALLTIEVIARDNGEEVFQSEWLTLSAPANRIVVTDSGRKDVGIDDLLVQPIPDPATGVLLLAGAAVMFLKRRR